MASRWTRFCRYVQPAFLTLPFALLGLRLFAAQVPTLAYPIVGEHRWRQSDVYSVAYNFVHESADFFHPRIDWTNGRSGVMGMEPPILHYLIHAAMRVFGDDPSVARTVSWAVCMLALAGFLFGTARYVGGGFALLLLGTLALSPMALYEMRQIQPDAPMALLTAAAAMLFVRAAHTERKRDYVAALLLFTIAVLFKGPAIVLAPAMPFFAIAAKRVSLRAFILRSLPLLLTLGLLLAWFAWARHLNEAFNAGRAYFAIADKPGDGLLADFFSRRRLAHLYGFVYATYVNNWTLFPALCAGLWAGLRAEYRRISVAFLVWLLFGSAFLMLFSSRLDAHWYYADLVLPAIAYFTAHGLLAACTLLSQAEPQRLAPYGLLGLLALLALALTPLAANGVQGALGPFLQRFGFAPGPNWTASIGHVRLLALVVAVAALLWLASPRASHVIASFAFCAVVLGALPRGAGDALETLAARAGTPAVIARYRKRVLEPLREAVSRYSTRRDLVVTNRRDPTTLHEALRKGFAFRPEGISKKKMRWFTKRKALLYIHYTDGVDPIPRELRRDPERYPLLAKNRHFRIYCLLEKCPELPR